MEKKLPADTQTHLPLGKKIGAELSGPYTGTDHSFSLEGRVG